MIDVPTTQIRGLYTNLKYFSQNTQLSMLKDFNRNNELVKLFNRSKKQFEPYENPEPFLNTTGRKKLPVNVKKISRADEIVSILKQNSINKLENDSILNFKYLEREVSTLRTTGGAKGRSNRSGTGGIDFIAWNLKNDLPVLGEIKSRGDENPFYAIIQLLTYLSELTTNNQLRRINDTKLFEPYNLNSNKFYLYILLSNYNENSSIKKEMLDGSIELSHKLKESIEEIQDIVILKLDSPTESITRI